MVLGPTVILATKTPNVGVNPLLKLVIFMFVGIRSSCLLLSFFNVVRGMMLRMASPFINTLDNIYVGFNIQRFQELGHL